MIETDRLIAPQAVAREPQQDWAIRPKTLREYVGQPAVSEQMGLFIEAAKQRKEPLDHTLIFGPPGLGKTTLTNIITSEMGVAIKSTAGPVIEKKGDLVAALTKPWTGDVLFIDEIHRVSPAVKRCSTSNGRYQMTLRSARSSADPSNRLPRLPSGCNNSDRSLPLLYETGSACTTA